MKAPRFCLLLTLLALSACKRPAEPPAPATLPSTSAPSVASAHVTPAASAAGAALALSWSDPAGWQRLPATNSMRRATYRVPHAASDSEDAELGVFYFGPSQGGGIDANVSRWIGQFSGVAADGVRRENRSANGLTQHVVEIESGTFAGNMPGMNAAPKTGFGLLGGIVESPSGPVFFKLTGPSKTVHAAHAAFYGLLDSVKPTS